MVSLSSWLRLYYFLKLMNEFNGYVLLAANADDFHNIAKKIVPESLANNLAQFASKPSVKQSQNRAERGESDYYYESEENYTDETEYSDNDDNVRNSYRSKDTQYVKESRISFDELVEQVKDRIAKEISEKLQNPIQNPQKISPTQSIYNNFEQREIPNHKLKVIQNTATVYKNNKDQNTFKPKKTYGYNSYKKASKSPNIFHYKEQLNNMNRYIKSDYQSSKEKTSSLKNNKYDHESFENNGYINNGESTEEQQEIGVSTKYNSPDSYLFSNSKKKYYTIKDKQSNLVKAKESNNTSYWKYNLTHSDGNKKEAKKYANTNFNEKHVVLNSGGDGSEANDDHYIDKDDYESKYEKRDPLKQKYINGSSKQTNKGKNTFVSPNTNKQSIYDEFDLVSKKKNDSYEDYIVPKVENRYASEENIKSTTEGHTINFKKSSFHDEKYKVKKIAINSNLQSVKRLKQNWQDVNSNENLKLTEDYREVTDNSEDIKAKTESLLYNYEDVEATSLKNDHPKDVDMISASPRQKAKVKGTMIPTREYFKMSSPNYYISLPTVAEKYDSDEPLPEKDRQREVIRHFVNPEDRINKKLKLN